MKLLHLYERQDWEVAAFTASSAPTAESGMEHRWGRRRPCRARAFLSAGGGLAGVGGLRNVSMSGAYLETELPLLPFTQIAVSVMLPDGSHGAEYTATVVRRDAGGVGIEWSETAHGPICDALGCGATCTFRSDRA
jgi:hypothetical protein